MVTINFIERKLWTSGRKSHIQLHRNQQCNFWWNANLSANSEKIVKNAGKKSAFGKRELLLWRLCKCNEEISRNLGACWLGKGLGR